MEVEDVSFVKKWVDLLEKQKSVLKNNSRRTGERPKDRQSRATLLMVETVQSEGPTSPF